MAVLCLSYEQMLKAKSEGKLASLPKYCVDPGHIYLTVEEKGCIVGVATIGVHQQNLHLETIEVAMSHRHRGVATAILESLYKMAGEEDKIVSHNGFTDLGARHIGHVIDGLDKKYGFSTVSVGRV